MADRNAEEAINNARAYANVLMDYIEGAQTPDPDDVQTSENCFFVTEDVVDHDPELVGIVVLGGLKMCRLLPDQAHWRKSASLAAACMAQKIGGVSPSTLPFLDDELRKLHDEFPDDAPVLSHWYSLITFRIASETEHAPEDAIGTLDRLKAMIGDTATVADEHAGTLAHALFIMALSVDAYGPDKANGWAMELDDLRQRLPGNEEVVSYSDARLEAQQKALERGLEMQRRRNSPVGRLKRLFGR